MERATKRRIASMIGVSMLLLSWACAHRPPAMSAENPAPITIAVSAEPTSSAGWTEVWVTMRNTTRNSVAFAMELSHRVAEDPALTYAYAQPIFARCVGGESSIFRLEPAGTFSVRFSVPTPSPVAERILVSAELEMCEGAQGRYTDYGETPLRTAALAERLALSGL